MYKKYYNMADRQIIQHLRTSDANVTPNSSDFEYGEIAINYSKDGEKIYIKNVNNEVIDFVPRKEVESMIDEAIINVLNTPV